ncbi:MAG: CDP-alcohol phosphatidyltransferase family protein [Firmicutes bacterium]|nr:CDP-alcohol phosphatidyltransferase family protein [Bacillota bacterium]
MERRTIGYYDYTVILTYCGMVTAVVGIFMSLHEYYWSAILCLMMAGVCDIFDGAIASTKDRNRSEKDFGIQIDSLSDLISFGVLPAVFVYMITGQNLAAGVVCAGYVLCALIRLAYFNVLEEERQRHSAERRKIYLGLPVTAAAAALPIAYLILHYGLITRSALFPVTLLLLGTAFLSPIEIRKPALLGKIAIGTIAFFEMVAMFLGMGWDVI